jgi:hypothetical protein
MRERTRPKSSSGQVSPAPSEYCCESLRPRSARRPPARPISPVRLMRGNRSAVATPIAAVDAAELALGDDEIGPAPQQLLRRADRQRGQVGDRQGRQQLRRRQLRGDRAQRLGAERRKPVRGAVDRGLQRRQRRLGAVGKAACARDVEPRAAPGVEPHLGQPQPYRAG